MQDLHYTKYKYCAMSLQNVVLLQIIIEQWFCVHELQQNEVVSSGHHLDSPYMLHNLVVF